MKRKRTRKNAEPTAAALSEAFHGRPAKRVTEYAEVVSERAELADLGRLVSLAVKSAAGTVEIDCDENKIRLAATPDGSSLYFVGGDQALNLRSLGLPKTPGKDHLAIGEVKRIVYFTSKAFHNFEPTNYKHRFGDEGGDLPLLCYDSLNQALYLVGGSYEVKPEGIVN